MMRLLISGGPGSGCTSTAKVIGARMGIEVFDSDAYFHKPSDPPFQDQNSPEERRRLLSGALLGKTNWIVSGSISNWGLTELAPTHGLFLNIPVEIRLQRLLERQRVQFGKRIETGGDMHVEHELFLDWASKYEKRSGDGRNLTTDREFLKSQCASFLSIDDVAAIEVIAEKALSFLNIDSRQNRL